MMTSSVRFVTALSIVSCFACQPRSPGARLPTDREASPEQPAVAAAPSDLRVFARTTGAPPAAEYLLLGRDQAAGSYRLLSATVPHPATTFTPRAAHSAWVAGHVVEATLNEATPASAAGSTAQSLALRVFPAPSAPSIDAPAEAAPSIAQIALPQPCTQTEPALLQGDATQLHALLRCPKEGYALLLQLDDQAHLKSSRRVPAAADAALYLHQPDGDYLAVARQVLRVPPGSEDTLPVIGTVPPPGGDSDTRELIRTGDQLLIVDGAAGRVIVMDALRMGWRTEKRFYSQGTVTRLRSVLTQPDRLCVVTTEETRQGTELFATLITLSDTSSQPPVRWQLGPAQRADHDLLPIADSDGGGALLLHSRRDASGAVLVQRRLFP